MITFGPIPSRRLGRSLGINNIPPKICTYSCVYCQVGRTIRMQADRHSFYKPEEILRAVAEKANKVREVGEAIDYLTFVPDGEPSLDTNLGREIDLLKPLGFKIAVITNASLLWREDVRCDLLKADWVSLKVDAVSEKIWYKVNRPHRALQFSAILNGMIEFASNYDGEITTETMLVKGINDRPEQAGGIADFLSQLEPNKTYVSVPTRPPAESWVQPPNETVINAFYQILSRTVKNVEYLVSYEGNAFAFTGNVEEDLLSVTAVHPVTADAVEELLRKARSDWSRIQGLIDQALLLEIEYHGKKFYVRKFPQKQMRCEC